MRRVERETGAQFQLRFRKQFNNVLVMDISYDNQELEVFSSGIDQVPPVSDEDKWGTALLEGLNSLRLRQMVNILQTTFSNVFSWMKIFEFQI